MNTVRLDNVSIILQKPRYSENIGASARVIRNMGMKDLIVVSPENLDLSKVEKMATHAALPVVEKIRVFSDLKEALAPFGYIVGTSARLGEQRQAMASPSQMARKLVSLSQSNPVALVFGPEDRGLSNEDLRLCHLLVNIPTAQFSSLNLAQAVMVICYEVFCAGLPRAETSFVPRLASRHELEGMYEQLKDILVRIDFINRENPDYWMNLLRKFFNRLPLRAREVRIIRGICRQMNWYAGKCYQDGLKAVKDDPASGQ